MAPPSSGAALQNLMVADADALNCGVCFLPLKPPIFQCPVGHVLCSQCRDKQLACVWLSHCYVCCIPLGLGYRRSHDMEKLVESIRAPCPNAAYGCDAKPAYYDLQPHLQACLHQPCHCPECGFVGGTKALLAHFTAAHQWPCTTDVRTGESFHMKLHDGFNVLDVADGATTKLLFLVMVSRESLGRAISAICVKADVGENEIYGLELEFDRQRCWHGDRQKSCFDVACTDLSNGLPHRNCLFPVPCAKYCSTKGSISSFPPSK